MRVVIADDSALLREGLTKILAEADIEVCAAVGDAEQLAVAVAEHQPDVALIDIRMPPTYTHEGAKAATQLRAAWPRLGILLVSQSLESRYAAELARENPAGFGYLLKDRVVDVAAVVDAVARVAAGGTVLDPDVVKHLLGRHATRNRMTELSEQEREVLTLMAQGRSDGAISRELDLSTDAVADHSASIFAKLGLQSEVDDHRRVLAVLAWLSPGPNADLQEAQPKEGRTLATVLFTDIVDSTATASRVGDERWRQILDDHDALVRRVVAEHSGRVIKSTGDGALATFDSPSRGIRAAVALHERAASLGLELRAGLHTGEIELRDDDIGGLAVHLAARVQACALAGEVLTTQTVRDLVVGAAFQFEPRGVRELKGLEGQWAVFAVV